MITRVGETIEIAAVFKAHGNVALASKLHNFFDAGILAALGDNDAIKGVAGFESFTHSVNAGETVHGKRVYR